MNSRTLAAIAITSIAAAIAVPTIASGNARRTSPIGSLNEQQMSETPYVAQLTGAAETPAGDPDGAGAAAVSFDGALVCWDLTYTGIATPIGGHIHRLSSGDVVVPFSGFNAADSSGCNTIVPTLAAEIVANPGAFYVNLHNPDFPKGAIRGPLSAGPAPSGSIHLLPTPLRAYDSRGTAAGKITSGSTRTISLTTGKTATNATLMALPPGATAAMVTITVTGTSDPGGYLKAYSAASNEPATSVINWSGADNDVATSTDVAVDAAGQMKVTAGGSSTHIVIDVVGYLY
jgi:CHRD domain